MTIEKIANPYPNEEHRDEVWANTETDEQRRTDCLCVRCAIGHNGDKTCEIGPQYLKLCQEYDNAFMMTRCAYYVPPEEPK